jgi:3-hydroxyisobutyrate dehydrogenase-like beta-hydroxyacid dehydrogenase
VSDSVLLRGRLADRSARVGLVGLGYVGLPLAVELARAGFATTGIDLDTREVDAVSQGTSVDTRNAIAGSHPHVFKLGPPSSALVTRQHERAVA